MPIPIEEYRIIPLTQGQITIVDTVDFESLSAYKWYARWNKQTKSFYAARNNPTDIGQETVWMHRVILGLTKGDKHQGDHQDHQTLNNRRYNLRVSTGKQNSRNRRLRSDSQVGLKGVTRQKSGRFQAGIWVNGKRKALGTYQTPELAHAAYSQAATEHFGEFAYMNCQEETPR